MSSPPTPTRPKDLPSRTQAQVQAQAQTQGHSSTSSNPARAPSGQATPSASRLSAEMSRPTSLSERPTTPATSSSKPAPSTSKPSLSRPTSLAAAPAATASLSKPPSSMSRPTSRPTSFSGPPAAQATAADSPTGSMGVLPDEADAEQEAELPLTMAASVVLTNLPRDARSALEGAKGVVGGGAGIVEKVTIHLRPISSAPALPGTQSRFKVSASQPFATVIRFLRRKLGIREGESVFCYVNQCFAPGLDEGVGGLWACFKTNDELVVHYAVHPAFG